MRALFARPVLSSLAFALASGSLFAQTPGKSPDELSLEELLNTPVVTASRFAQSSGDAPATVVIISQEQIKRRGYKSLAEVLQDLPDFKAEMRSDPEWMNDFTVRGVPGHDKFVLLLDGLKISPATNEQIPITTNYPIHMAKQIEVVYGPASALYGADAISGVVNIISKEPSGLGEATQVVDADNLRLLNLYLGLNLGAGAQLILGGQWSHDPQPDLEKTWSDFGNFNAMRTNSFQTIFGPQSATAPIASPDYPVISHAFFGALKVDAFKFNFFVNSVRFSSAQAYTTDNAIYERDSFLGHRTMAFGASYTKSLDQFDLLTSLSSNRYDLDPGSNFRNAFTGMGYGYKFAQSGSFKAEQQVTWHPSKGLTLIGGASYEVLQATPWSTDLASPVDPVGAIKGKILGTNLDADFYTLKYDNKAAYLQAQVGVSDSLSATLGARYDDNSRYGSSLNPRAGIVWHVDKNNTLKLLYGTAYLAPSPLVAFAHFGSFFRTTDEAGPESYFWRLPNPGLKPIKERSLELSYRVYLGQDFSFSLTAYETRLTNLYALQNDGDTLKLYNGKYKGLDVAYIEVRVNQGKQRNLGGNAQLDYLHNFGATRVGASLGYSYVDGKVDFKENGQEYPIGQIAPSILRLGGEFGWRTWSFSPRITRVSTQRQFARDAQNQPITLDGYTTLNLHLRWDPMVGVGFFLTATNATNAKYRNIVAEWAPAGQPHWPGAPQDPRRISLGVQAKF